MTVLAFRSEMNWVDAIEPVRRHLATGNLLAYPTETVYGVGSRPYADDAVALAALKQRRDGKPFLLLVDGCAMAEEWGLEFTPAAHTLSDAFWPGPLTLVLRCEEGSLLAGCRGAEGGVAVRWTAHKGVETLVRGLEYPLTSTSANRRGGTPASGVDSLISTFGTAIEDGTLLVLDGGILGDTPPSTIVDCMKDPPRVIRAGAIPVDELRADVGSLTS